MKPRTHSPLAAAFVALFCVTASHSAGEPLASGARLPQTITAKQRSTTSLASMGLPLTLTIGDISAGEVLTRIATKDGANVFGPRAMHAGERVPIDAGRRLSLTLDALDHALVGEDYATFTVNAVAALSETEKIERLLGAIEALPNARFVRNGKDYAPREAVDHLRRKWKAASGEADDARRFVDELASMSSLSGKPYEIRYADGRTATVREFLLGELAQLEQR